jgi:hypothetical protein
VSKYCKPLIIFVALIENQKEPLVFGVPDITPVDESDNPFGREPPDMLHVIGAVPVATIVWL